MVVPMTVMKIVTYPASKRNDGVTAWRRTTGHGGLAMNPEAT